MKVVNPSFLLLVAGLSLTSLAANAHTGEHGHSTLLWLLHMLSSIDHLFALLAVTLLVGITAGVVRRYKRRSFKTPEQAPGLAALKDR